MYSLEKNYENLAAWAPGETITSTCVGEVKASRCSKFPNGTLITGMMPWAEYCVIDCNQPFPIGPAEIPKMDGMVGKEAMFLGVFGTTGLTGKPSNISENDQTVYRKLT